MEGQSSLAARPVLSVPVVGMVFLLLAAGSYAALIAAPTEATMGLIQRIFYFHVASGWAFMAAYAVVFLGSVSFLRTRNPRWDWLAVSASEVGLAFNTVSLVTGSIWAKPVWGIWWTWDPRLTSTFLLWIMFIAYLVLRTLAIDPERRGIVSAVFGIFACLDIPMVYFSIWWFRTQHPQPVIGDGGSLDSRMFWVLMLCCAMTSALAAVLIRVRYRLEALRAEVDELRMEAETSEI